MRLREQLRLEAEVIQLRAQSSLDAGTIRTQNELLDAYRANYETREKLMGTMEVNMASQERAIQLLNRYLEQNGLIALPSDLVGETH